MTKRKSAFSQAMKEAQQQASTVEPLHSETVKTSEGEAVELRYRETEERSHSNTVTQQDSSMVKQFQGDTTTPQNGETVKVKKERKVSFYLTPEQENKLYGLEIEYYQRRQKRINRNDIVRHLIDQCDITSLENLGG